MSISLVIAQIVITLDLQAVYVRSRRAAVSTIIPVQKTARLSRGETGGFGLEKTNLK